MAPDRSGDLTLDSMVAGSPEAVWWNCPAGPDHEWQASLLVIGTIPLSRGNTGCPLYTGKRASVAMRVAEHPELSREWHPTANGDLRAEDTMSGR